MVVGFLTGLFGVGGGFLIIPALVLLLGLPMTAAVDTFLVIIVINSVAGFATHAGSATIDYRIAAGFTVAAIAGSLAAARFATRLPTDRPRRWFAYLVFVIAAFVAIQALFNPPTGHQAAERPLWSTVGLVSSSVFQRTVSPIVTDDPRCGGGALLFGEPGRRRDDE
jgi:hypothetical protein